MKCWDHSPKERPTMCDVLHMLCHEEQCCSRYETMRDKGTSSPGHGYQRILIYLNLVYRSPIIEPSYALRVGKGYVFNPTNRAETILQANTRPVNCVRFSRDGEYIAVASGRSVLIYGPGNSETHSSYVHSYRFAISY